jgi:hypothetical protein
MGRTYEALPCGCLVSEDSGGGLIPCCYEPEDVTEIHKKCMELYFRRKFPTYRIRMMFNQKHPKFRFLKRNNYLEGIIKRQKHVLAQLNAIVKETRFLLKSKQQEAYFDMVELINSLEDDLQMDEKGEFGYKTEKEVIKAIRRYTLELLDRKLKKWEKLKQNKNEFD